MKKGEAAIRPKTFRTETVCGEPYHIEGRKLTPVARVVTFGKAKGTIGADAVSGFGGGFVRVTPLAILEETDEGERRIPLTDATSNAVKGMVVAVLAVTFVSIAIRWLVRR